MRQNLIVVRAGDASLHPQWIAGSGPRNFDLFVSYFGDSPGRYSEYADHYEAVAGFKWPSLARLFATRADLLLAYDACWFPDDDLAADAESISRMFELFHAHALWLAQPALGPGSHVSHAITSRVAGSRLRFTDFVEIMCPIFNRHALRTLGPTFVESISGWGLDFLWPKLLGDPLDRVAILDETPVMHTRPVATGRLYDGFAGAGVNPWEEARNISMKHQLVQPARFRVHRTVPAILC